MSRVTVRPAETGELPAVMNVVDGAALEADATTVGDRIADGSVLVAVDGERVLGACVVAPGETDGHLEAIAVRPGRRALGVGSALIDEAADRWGTLTADFDGSVRPFYESLGFEVEPVGDGRYRGRLGAGRVR